MNEISKSTETKLREAMERLLGGRATSCNGQLTKSNLAREAGVSRATMHRAQTLLREWDARTVGPAPKSEEVTRLEEQLAHEKATVRRLRAELRGLRGRLNSAAAVMLEMQTLLSEKRKPGGVSQLKARRKSQQGGR